MSHQHTVYVVDDDPEDRHSLAYQLGQYGIEAWPFASGADFLASIGHLRPQCVILSMEIPHQGGLQLMKDLLVRGIIWPVIALSDGCDLRMAIEAMKLGAVDFLKKPIDVEALMEAIRPASVALQQAMQQSEVRRLAEERVANLSPRELDISRALVRGSPNKVVAHQLGISVRTVEAHRANIMMKLGVRSVAELVLLVTEASHGPLAAARPREAMPHRPPGGGTVALFPGAPTFRRPSSRAAI